MVISLIGELSLVTVTFLQPCHEFLLHGLVHLSEGHIAYRLVEQFDDALHTLERLQPNAQSAHLGKHQTHSIDVGQTVGDGQRTNVTKIEHFQFGKQGLCYPERVQTRHAVVQQTNEIRIMALAEFQFDDTRQIHHGLQTGEQRLNRSQVSIVRENQRGHIGEVVIRGQRRIGLERRLHAARVSISSCVTSVASIDRSSVSFVTRSMCVRGTGFDER